MDALAEMLRSMRLAGGVFLDAELTAPWCIRSQVGPNDCPPAMPEPERLIAYHYVVDGRLLVSVDGAPPRAATAGHLLLLPRNDRHRLGSDPVTPATDADALIEPAAGPGHVARIRFGGGGERTRLLCGFLGCTALGGPLVASLPPLVTLDLADHPAGAWIEGSMRYAAAALQSGDAGAVESLSLLAELLLAEAVRAYAASRPPESRGWLAGLADPYVGRALALLHAQPAAAWSLPRLAGEVGLARSALSERFRRRLGESPMRYLARHRLQRAAERLRDSTVPISRIAYDSGYASESSFNRAFRRAFGVAPGAFRRQHNGAVAQTGTGEVIAD